MVGVSFKKLLGINLIVVVSVFGMMLTTSYAWYSFENASTKFDVVTSNEDVDVVFQKGDYINTDSAIPVKREEVDLYSDKYDFNIRVKKSVLNNEMVARISLVDIVIDSELRKIDETLGEAPFRFELYYQGNQIGKTVTGDMIHDVSYDMGDIVLSDSMDNKFEFRVYLLDNGKEQSYLMNKSFQAKIDVNIVSRVSTNIVSFENPDIHISHIMIDGKESKYLPVSGYYDMSADCEMGSDVTWNSSRYELVYGKGSYSGDRCSLNFVESKNVFYLKDVSKGSYVSYVGNNGCVGDACRGVTANYQDEYSMGYCGKTDYHYGDNGFRVGYILDNHAYLVSAGGLECTSQVKNIDKIALKYCNRNYVSDGVCSLDTVWGLHDSDIQNILDGSDAFHYDLIDVGGYYWYYNVSRSEYMVWDPSSRSFSDRSAGGYGIRVVVKLDSSVKVIGGSGTKEHPYIISK